MKNTSRFVLGSLGYSAAHCAKYLFRGSPAHTLYHGYFALSRELFTLMRFTRASRQKFPSLLPTPKAPFLPERGRKRCKYGTDPSVSFRSRFICRNIRRDNHSARRVTARQPVS